jgi:diguanylate cyclase (GGDEF)-like protein
MSSELSRTLDSRERGTVMARHMALATGVDECAISYWDRPGNRVLTYGYYPPERAVALEAEYSLEEYPETQRVLSDQVVLVVVVDDPAADANEVRYLRSIDATTSAMLPLVAGGQTIGLAELTARRHVRFDPARLALAESMANEAAMALEAARLYEQLEHQALHDVLTGLPNRALFINRLRHGLAKTRRMSSQVGLLYLDLDHFKRINDGLGHAAGDRLLTLVGQRLVDHLRPGDTVARLGGDEFGILLDPVAGQAEASEVAERLLAALAEPFTIDGVECRVRGSIGAAVGSAGRTDADELLANADVAMYRAKQRGKARWEPFHPSLRAAAAERAETAAGLAVALERGEFVVHYQPIFRLATGTVEGVEALVRWMHPERGVVGPDDFIGLAEEIGVIVEIGRWVLQESCRQVAAWQRRLDRPDLSLHVNLSAVQFEQSSVVPDVRAALDRSGLPPKCLTLEITESLLMNDEPSVLRRLRELKALGVRLAIDDFGTGYSSLQYLQRFPIDSLKIDKAFVAALGVAEEARGLVQAIIQIARTLNLEAVAEGVEHPQQQDLLSDLNCELGQGFALSHPHAAADIEALLVSRNGSKRRRRSGAIAPAA